MSAEPSVPPESPLPAFNLLRADLPAAQSLQLWPWGLAFGFDP